MYLCLMYVCPDVSNSGGGDVPTSDVSKSAPSAKPLRIETDARSGRCAGGCFTSSFCSPRTDDALVQHEIASVNDNCMI